MSTHSVPRQTVALLTAFTLAACSQGDAPTGAGDVSSFFDAPPASTGELTSQTVKVCKVGPAGSTATFSVTASGGELLLGAQFTVNASPVDDGTGCVDAWRAGSSGSTEATTVTVTEVGASAGTQLAGLEVSDYFGTNSYAPPVNSGTVTVNFYHGAVFTYTNEEVVPPGGACEGKVTKLTLQYLGSANPANVLVRMKSTKKVTGAVIFNGAVAPGGTFTFSGADKWGTMGTNIELSVNGVANASIHTSCSQPIGPGLIRGDFLVVSGESRGGGVLPPL